MKLYLLLIFRSSFPFFPLSSSRHNSRPSSRSSSRCGERTADPHAATPAAANAATATDAANAHVITPNPTTADYLRDRKRLLKPLDAVGAAVTPEELLAVLSKGGSTPEDVMAALSASSSSGYGYGESGGGDGGVGVVVDDILDSFESAFYTDSESRRIEIDDMAYRSLRRDRDEERRRTRTRQQNHFHVPEQRLEKVTSPRCGGRDR